MTRLAAGRALRPAPVVRVAQGCVLLVAAAAAWAVAQAPRPEDLGGWAALLVVALTVPGLAAAVAATRIEDRGEEVFIRVLGRRYDLRAEDVVAVEDGGRGPVVRTEAGVPTGWRLLHRDERAAVAAALRRHLRARDVEDGARGPT